MTAKKKADGHPAEVQAELARALASGGLSRGYLLRGEEPWYREHSLELLRAKARGAGYELCSHSAERANADFRLSSLIEDVSGGGLFAAQRFIALRRPDELLKNVEGKRSPLTEALLRFLEHAQDLGTLVIHDTSVRADHPVAKAIGASGGALLGFRKLWDSAPYWNPDPAKAELVQWLLARARERGVRLDPTQAIYVCAATGNDLFALDGELERLGQNAGKSVAEVVAWRSAAPPWIVAEHIVAGDLPLALAGLEALFQSGMGEDDGRRVMDPAALGAMLVGSLVRQVRQAHALSRALGHGRGEGEALELAGFQGRPEHAAALLARARERASSAWRARLVELAELERRLKGAGIVDRNDFARLALSWRSGVGARAGVPARSRR